MTAATLGPDSLFLTCPECGWFVQMIDRYLERRFPRDMLLTEIVVRHVCRPCRVRGRTVRPVGEIHPYPRSGAEGEGGRG
jgi:hypothetical protein